VGGRHYAIHWVTLPVDGSFAYCFTLASQNVNVKHPEEFQVQKQLSPDDMRARVANLQLRKDAKELAELCTSVPSDMNGVKQGLMSQDMLEKLKRVEKLSKRVREQLTRASTAPSAY
jgi:hypothetical protein